MATVVLLAGWALAAHASADGFEVACPSDVERRVIALVNDERAARGLGALALDVRLGAAAVRHSEDMADGCFLSHTGSDGSSAATRVSEAGYGFYAGEVAGVGQQASPQQIVGAWMNSSGHAAILMRSESTHIGVGQVSRGPCPLVGYGFSATAFWTANLGRDPAPPFAEDEYCLDGLPVDPVRPCDDGIDNDGDGLVDYMQDMGCISPEDVSELPVCADGIDNDGDGLVDYPADPHCLSSEGYWEHSVNCGLGAELVVLLPPLVWLRRKRGRD